MLATVIALHLATAQAPGAEPPPPPPPPEVEESLRERPEVGEPAPPAPPPDEPIEPIEEELRPSRPRILPARQTAKTALVPIPSFLTAEPLRGHSTVVAWAGWSSLGAGWAQGVTNEDDLGVVGDLDWSTAELRVSGWYRRPLGRVGLVEIGARMRAGWYADLGARWFHDDNARDRGIEVVPGLVVSTRGAGGVFALGGDLPIVVTLWRDGGIFASPKATLSYETALYGDLTVGVRVSGAYRAGSGDAPLAEPRSLLELNALVGWRIF